MLRKPIAPFAPVVTGNETTQVLSVADVSATTGTPRSPGVFVPALSTVCVRITGTASVSIISNPFDNPGLDKVLTTLAASGDFVVPSATVIVVNVTANTGTVTCLILSNESIDC